MRKHNADSAMSKYGDNTRATKLAALMFAILMLCILFSGCANGVVNALSENEALDSQLMTTDPTQTEKTEASVEPSQTENIETSSEPSQTEEPPVSAEPSQTEEPPASVEPSQTEEPPASVEPSQTEDSAITSEPVQTESAKEPVQTTKPEAGAAEEIKEFTNQPISIEISRGTAIEKLPLPKTLSALAKNGNITEVPVTWTNVIGDGIKEDKNDYKTESQYEYGPWIFTAAVDAPYTYSGEPVTAKVRITDCKEISSFIGVASDGLLMRFVIFQGGTVNLPINVIAIMSDGGYKNIPVSWSGNYDNTTVGTYELKMKMKDGYTGGKATAEIAVIQDLDDRGAKQ